MAAARVLLVDDDPQVRRSLADLLAAEGLETRAAASAEEALEAVVTGGPCDLAVADLHLPGEDGVALTRRLRLRFPEFPVILITGQGIAAASAAALESGVSDFLAKPVDDQELLFRVRRILSMAGLRRENRALREHLQGPEGWSGLIGRHAAMQQVFATVAAVAETRATVLIHGESGTGKTMLARALHLQSDRREGPFIEVACGALPEDLIESELFGHVRGSFTGAIADRRGKVEAAHGGTLFLDEIGVASHALQVKLLRVIQEKTFERVGSSDTVRADLRLVLATNMNLEEEVRGGRFRQDLYYRINVVTVELPPLRERPGDIPALAGHFLGRFGREHRRPGRWFHPDALSVLCRHRWPGNVRELENVVERAVVLSREPTITAAEFPPALTASGDGAGSGGNGFPRLKEALAPAEREHLRRALRQTGGNRGLAADILGINRSTLFNKMRKHGLLDEDYEGKPA